MTSDDKYKYQIIRNNPFSPTKYAIEGLAFISYTVPCYRTDLNYRVSQIVFEGAASSHDYEHSSFVLVGELPEGRDYDEYRDTYMHRFMGAYRFYLDRQEAQAMRRKA